MVRVEEFRGSGFKVQRFKVQRFRGSGVLCSGFSPAAGMKSCQYDPKRTLKNRMTKGGIAALYLF